MYRLDEINEALLHLVGWEQAYNPAEAIESGLTASESGLTFQGAHPLMTLANVRAAMPDDFGYDYSEWSSATQYHTGDKVRITSAGSTTVYIATADNINQNPALSSSWKQYNMLSDFLTNSVKNGINTAVLQFVESKEIKSETKTLMERRTFFDGAARLQATIQNKHKIVGMEIVPVRAMGVTAKIERIGLQMIGATGTIKMYLFHSSQRAPRQTITLNFTNTSGGFQWFIPQAPVYLPYISTGNDSGGAWYLVYCQDELPQYMEALNVSKDWSREPCATCLGGSIESWKELTKYLQVSPFCTGIPAGFLQTPQLWDIAQNSYTNTMNYGINCEISVGCDLTDFIIEQKMMFASVIQKQVAVNLLRTIAMNPDVRVNRNQANVSRMDILYELDGNTNSNKPGGLGNELKAAYKALSLDTRGIDRVCLSCNNHGVKYRVI